MERGGVSGRRGAAAPLARAAWGLGVISALLLLGCDHGARKGDGKAAPLASQEAALAAVGQKVRVAGKAADAKLSAAVQTPGGLLVYCIEKHDWPAEQHGKAVVVAGTLEHSDAFQAQTGPDGAISQGTDAKVFVLRGCEVE